MGMFKDLDIDLHEADETELAERVKEYGLDLAYIKKAYADVQASIKEQEEKLLEGYELNPDGSVPNDSY